MGKKLKSIQAEFQAKIPQVNNISDLKALQIEYLGRKEGKLNIILRGLAALSPTEKPRIGQLANEVKCFMVAEIEKIEKQTHAKHFENIENEEWTDITIPGDKPKLGALHLITQFINVIHEVFGRMGFDIADGPEIETEYFNFSALNIPADHPARDMQDTFFIKNMTNHVLRSHTSNVQIRYMEKHKPPLRFVAPGKTFRKDNDATHSPMFHQFEGFMVDQSISIANLRSVLINALSELLQHQIDIRFRTSYFPFVEPGLEVDATCVICNGTGRLNHQTCNICKGSKWLEMGGAGSIHPQVLKNVNIDPTKYCGFAFGFGIERLIMTKYKINNMKLLFENDLRFLSQF
jgi:phenylalanyl-tRNA synthetase alpha chain